MDEREVQIDEVIRLRGNNSKNDVKEESSSWSNLMNSKREKSPTALKKSIS